MILSIGTDIIEVYRIRETIERTPRFLERVYTPAEKEYCEAKGAAKFQSYAGKFAAKEAFLKALGTGWRGKLSWQEIEILNNDEGMPYFCLSGEAAKHVDAMNGDNIHLTISHTTEHATSTVVIEKNT